MLYSTSVKTRLLVSVASNGIRGIILFASGLLIARGLNPSGYGDFMFLLGSFAAIRPLLDMGSSSAFYTFLSRHTRDHRFYWAYFLWLALQFVIILSFVALIIPADILDRVWVGHSRAIVIIAFLAAFMQQQAWQTVGQIGESMRKTILLQLLNLGIAISYLGMVALLLYIGCLSIENILLLIIFQYIAATFLAYRLLKGDQEIPAEKNATPMQIFQEYWVYCKPLIVLSLVSFLYEFAEKWMLQKFGGAAQQGYFQIANQISAVSLMVTVSILGVFWKEVSKALANQDHARVAMLYRKINRGLVMMGAIIAGFLLPWSEQIVMFLLGPAYAKAWPVLSVMLIFPIYQAMSQIAGVMFFSSGQTKKYMLVSMGSMLVSLPLSYFLLAPSTGMLLPGLAMGSMGFAIKLVLWGIISTNVQVWVVARFSGWKFDWIFQAVGIPLMIGLGFVAKILAEMLWGVSNASVAELIVPVIIAGMIYSLMVMAVVWRLPWLIGSDRCEIKILFGRLKARY